MQGDMPSLRLTCPRERIRITGSINEQTREEVSSAITHLENSGVGELILELDSDGGDADAGIDIVHLLEKTAVQSIGFVTGEVRSTASLILQGCTERIMLAHARLQMHFFSKRITAKIAYDEELLRRCLESLRSDQERFIEIYMRSSGLSREKILLLLSRGNDRHVMSAKEALEYGLIDSITPHPF